MAGCGGGDDSTSSSTTAASTAATSTTSTSDSQGGNQGGTGDDNGNGGSQSSDDSQGSQGSSNGNNDSAQGGPTDHDEYGSRLRAVVANGLTNLAPITSPSAATGDPNAYADLLGTASDDLDDTISDLEALDGPADAEQGTQQIIDAFSRLRDALDDGAQTLTTGGSQPAAIAKLRQAGADFTEALAKARQTLAAAGYQTPGDPTAPGSG